jgi:uncharacterized protein (TIGR02145 family)/prepilin-type N-terminal cleavage/methylation domain-containing protein
MFKYLKSNACPNDRSYSVGREGFTLIELLIVIGILAILATTVVMVINPAEMVKQSRDSNRIVELNSINKALLVYQSFGGSSSMGTSNTIYISLPDSNSQCGSYYADLSATSTGWNYHCSPEADYRKTDGTGWIPVDLTSVESSSGSLFASLPIDPTNTATGQLYYTYIPGSWALSTIMESTKYLAANATSDGGVSSSRFEVGNDLSLNIAVDCTGFTYGGQEYGAVIIGTQCWMAENLNVGTKITSCSGGYIGICTANSETAQEQGTDCPSASEIEKYCYDDDEANCTSDGGFYGWNQAMCGSTVVGAQGICPDDWHVATDAEWCILENEADSSSISCSSTGWRGTDVGINLKVGGATSFEALSAGNRNGDGSFANYGATPYFWTSSISSGSTSIARFMQTGSLIYRHVLIPRTTGLSIRCIKD